MHYNNSPKVIRIYKFLGKQHTNYNIYLNGRPDVHNTWHGYIISDRRLYNHSTSFAR